MINKTLSQFDDQHVIKVIGIKFKSRHKDFETMFPNPLLIDVSFVNLTNEFPEMILTKYGVHMNEKLNINNSSLRLAMSKFPNEVIQFHDLIDELSGNNVSEDRARFVFSPNKYGLSDFSGSELTDPIISKLYPKNIAELENDSINISEIKHVNEI